MHMSDLLTTDELATHLQITSWFDWV